MERDHGERAKYVVEGCRCLACSLANRIYAAENELARLYGEVDLVPADKVRAHLRALGEQGVGYKQAAKVAGSSKSATMKILNGTTARVRSDTAARLLAVTPADVAQGQYVDAAETWSYVGTLLELGYPKAWISFHIGQGGRALQLGKARVTKRNADAIKALAIVTGDMRYDFRSNVTVEEEASLQGRYAALLEGLITSRDEPADDVEREQAR